MKSFVKELREMPTQCAKITQKVSFHTKNVLSFEEWQELDSFLLIYVSCTMNKNLMIHLSVQGYLGMMMVYVIYPSRCLLLIRAGRWSSEIAQKPNWDKNASLLLTEEILDDLILKANGREVVTLKSQMRFTAVKLS